MPSPVAELRKNGKLDLSNGGKIIRDRKGVAYEAALMIRVPLRFVNAAIEAASKDEPIVVLLEAMMGLNYPDVAQRVAKLTPRENQIFEGVASGKKSRQIAADFGISPTTLNIHRQNIARKLGTKSLCDFSRVFWFFRLCHEFHPAILERFRSVRSQED